MDKKKLYGLIDEYWKDFCACRNLDIILKQSVPIIWFGNLNEYEKSEKKIITVALNPSDREFEYEGKFSFHRFPMLEGLNKHDSLSKADRDMLIKGYNQYFKNDYLSWFNTYEKIMGDSFPDGIKASYFEVGANRVIHIDYYTALATNQKWTYIGKNSKKTIKTNEEKKEENRQKNIISESGRKLFTELMEYLNPDIILFSANDKARQEILKVFKGGCTERINKMNPNNKHRLISYNASGKLFIFGSNDRFGPLAGIDEKDKWLKEVFDDYKSWE